METIEIAKIFLDNPLMTADVVTGAIGIGGSYIGYATAAAGITIPVAGQIALGAVGVACGIWGLYRIWSTNK